LDVSNREKIKMEDISPPLNFALELQNLIENGKAISSSIYKLIDSGGQELSPLLKEILITWERGGEFPFYNKPLQATTRALLQVVWIGLRGEPILTRLKEVIVEIKMENEHQLNLYIKKLPFIGLIPVFLFQVPAFLLLILGPILSETLKLLSQR